MKFSIAMNQKKSFGVVEDYAVALFVYVKYFLDLYQVGVFLGSQLLADIIFL